MTEAPQEFDERGKELSPDAQVWKTYVREADQVDEELIDGWNKSMDVILIFAALFSAISTAFVIESYKNLKQDPTELSSQTLLAISQTLIFIANGSQPTSTALPSETQAPVFRASTKAICVNVLWFLSLSLSVAVSLISMLAKEWCLEYMVGRTGPAGAQARRRQQRWDGLVHWRMKELIMMLPSLIHMSLLLFAIGLCVFLWDVHYGVAIPVVIVTTFAASAYLACTVVPFLYDYCPYGTVLSRLAKEFMTTSPQPGRESIKHDEVTANALNWMIVNCETPRSVDIALQSLSAADENLPTTVLEKCHAWAMIKQRLEWGDIGKQSEQHRKAGELYAHALEVYPITRRKIDMLAYGHYDWIRREEQLVLGIQATIRSLINEVFLRKPPKNVATRQVLNRCAVIGPNYLSYFIGDNNVNARRRALAELVDLVEDLVNRLERYLKGEVTFEPDLYRALSASLAFILCCNAARPITEQLNLRCVLRLIRGYSSGLKRTGPQLIKQTIAANLVQGTLWPLIRSGSPDEPWTNHFSPKPLEHLWATLMSTAFSDSSTLERPNITYLAHSMLYLLSNANRYGLSREDCVTMDGILDRSTLDAGLPTKIQSIYHAHYLHCLSQNITSMADTDGFAPQVLIALKCLWYYSPWEGLYVLPTSEIYIFLVKHLCMTSIATYWDDLNAYKILAHSPIPKCSPRLVQMLSSRNLITQLSNAIESKNHDTQIFAIAQLWLFLDMSISEANRSNNTIIALEAELLKCPMLENNLERQEAVAEELEGRLKERLHKVSSDLEAYPYRVQEVMLQRRSTPLPPHTSLKLKYIPEHLRGIKSFVNIETERLIVYPDLAFDSEGRPSLVPPPNT